MAFPDPDERPGDDRRLSIEFAILLGLFLVSLVAGLRELWRYLSTLL